MGVIATLSGWINENNVTVSRMQDILRRYLCTSWSTEYTETEDEGEYSWHDMVVGWSIARYALLGMIGSTEEEFYGGKLTLGREDALLAQHICTPFVELLDHGYSMIVKRGPINASRYISLASPLAKEAIQKLFQGLKVVQDDEALRPVLEGSEGRMREPIEHLDFGNSPLTNFYFNLNLDALDVRDRSDNENENGDGNDDGGDEEIVRETPADTVHETPAAQLVAEHQDDQVNEETAQR